MNENITLAIIGIGLGFFGAAVWYAEMFTDSKAANLWRRMNGKGRISRNYAAIGAPAFACIFLLGGILGLIADWQYAKRHGLLDDDGNIDREAWARHHANKRDLW